LFITVVCPLFVLETTSVAHIKVQPYLALTDLLNVKIVYQTKHMGVHVMRS